MWPDCLSANPQVGFSQEMSANPGLSAATLSCMAPSIFILSAFSVFNLWVQCISLPESLTSIGLACEVFSSIEGDPIVLLSYCPIHCIAVSYRSNIPSSSYIYIHICILSSFTFSHHHNLRLLCLSLSLRP